MTAERATAMVHAVRDATGSIAGAVVALLSDRSDDHVDTATALRRPAGES